MLDQYEHMPSFSGIQNECDEIMVQLRSGLRTQLKDAGASHSKLSTQEMSNCVYLLLCLNTPPADLCEDYLQSSRVRLEDSLAVLDRQVVRAKRSCGSEIGGREGDAATQQAEEEKFEGTMDILEFVDHGCNHFLSDACIIIASYNETFLSGGEGGGAPQTSALKSVEANLQRQKIDSFMATEKLLAFVTHMMETFFKHVRARTILEKNLNETAILARALDRFHRRLQAMSRLLPTTISSQAKVKGSHNQPKMGQQPIATTDFAQDALDLVLDDSSNFSNFFILSISF